MSRAKSPEKGGSSEPQLNPDARTFRPRRFQDGNQSTSFSGEETSIVTKHNLRNTLGGVSNQARSAAVSRKDDTSHRSLVNDATHSLDQASKLCPPTSLGFKRNWTGSEREALKSNENHGVSGTGEVHEANGQHTEQASSMDDSIAHICVSSMPKIVRRRQAASEPFPENGSEQDDSENASEDGNTLHSAKYSRLPQLSPRRAVSAIDRKTGQSNGANSTNGNEPPGPTNTAATSPSVLCPEPNQKTSGNNSPAYL